MTRESSSPQQMALASAREQKIAIGEMREMGVRGLLVYCADYKCAHAVRITADRWPDHIRLSDLEPLFVCQACGRRARPSAALQASKTRRAAGCTVQEMRRAP